jgi:hypothetical protein
VNDPTRNAPTVNYLEVNDLAAAADSRKFSTRPQRALNIDKG